MRYVILISTTRKGNKMQIQSDLVLKAYTTERGANNYKAKFYANDDNVVIRSYPNQYETTYLVIDLGF